MASTNIQTFPGKVGVSNTNPIHTLDIGSNVYIDDTAQTKLRIIGNIHASGVTVDGTITAIDSENLSVKDPIILLASGSTGTSDTGIIMKRADGDSNVAVFYDEGVGLKIGHTLSTAQDIHISVDSSNSLSTSIYGPVTVAHSSAQALVVQGGAEIADDFKVGASKLFVDVSESNVGIGTDAPLATLDVHGTANVGALTVVSISGDGSALSSIQSSNVSDFASNVGRIATLETDLTSNVTRITNLESSDMTIGGEKTFSSNLEVGTANLFVDTTTSNVGIGTTNPGALLELSKATGSATISPTELRLSTRTNAADWSVTDPWARLSFYTDDVTGDAPGVMASVGAVASSVNGGENTRLAFFTAEPHLERMCVDRYGNVGIGTTSPAYKLDVHGTSNVGALTATSGTFSGALVINGGPENDTTPALTIGGGIYDESDLYVLNTYNVNTGVGYAAKVLGVNIKNKVETNNSIQIRQNTGGLTSAGAIYLGSDDINQGIFGVLGGTGVAGTTLSEHLTVRSDGNVGIGTTSPGYKLDVHGTANVGVLSATLPLATVASNLVTYDTATGQLLDSNGLVSNKLSIVSEQPPSALTGATTTVSGHGKYVVTSSSVVGENYDYNIFSKNETDAWISLPDTFNVDGTYAGSESLGGVSGEWVKLEMPYKTTLRHFTLRHDIDNTALGQRRQFPVDFKIVASNDDTNWQTLNTTTGVSTPEASDPALTFVVNASASYKFYAIVVEKITSGANFNRCHIGEWKLFTETFTVDAGKVNMTGASGLETGFTEHPVAPMTGYHTYVEGHGTYEASESSVFSGTTAYGWKIFDYNIATALATNGGYDSSTGAFTSDVTTTDVGGTRYNGHWVQIKTPYPITLSHSNVYPTNVNRSPVDSVILGSNDGENWYKLNEFTGQTYSASTWKRLDVNATTPYQYYRMCVTKKAIGDTVLGIREWRLFAEKDVTKFENVHISGDLSSETIQTGYIKWPRKPLKANESEGYVVDASSADSGFTRIYSVFNDLFIGQSTEYWDSASTYSTSTGAHNNTVSTTDIDGVVRYGEWVQIKLTNAIALHSMKWYPRIFYSSGTTYATWPLERVPKSGVIMGSNDGITWRTLRDFADISYTTAAYVEGTEVKVISSTPYVYYRLVITSLNAGTSSNRAGIMELQLFEAATGVGGAPTSAKLQVHGSLGLAKGSSLYAGDSVVAEFPKHDRPLTKYPEVAMTANSSGGYVASASSSVTREPWEAFDNSDATSWTSNYVFTGSPLTGDEYLQLQLPVAIKVVKMYIQAVESVNYQHAPQDAELLGSNDGTTWVSLNTSTDLPLEAYGASTWVHVNATQYYKYLRLRITKIYSGLTSYARVAELQYWGHEEGDESVDVVHRSVPNKPGQQQLAVYWDANDSNSYSFADSSNVYDLSGSGVTGALTNGVGFDSTYNAFTFDGSNDVMIRHTGQVSITGEFVHSFRGVVLFGQ